MAENLRGIGVANMVPHYRSGGRLNKDRGLARPDVEIAPIDDRVGAGLNRQLRALSGKGRRTLRYYRVGRIAGRRTRRYQRQQRHKQGRPATAAILSSQA